MPDLTGVEFIAAERERQRGKWGDRHDDTHDAGELAMAAACYAVPYPDALASGWSWPFEPETFNRARVEDGPSGQICDLVKAGALIAAEIDRLQRAGDNERETSQ